jgi:hypothetical protein
VNEKSKVNKGETILQWPLGIPTKVTGQLKGIEKQTGYTKKTRK